MQEEAKRYIGDYEILNRLGAGGMGEVYKVRNVISDRIEAMKILLPSLAGNKQLDDRFRREIKLVASLNHPNIASLCTALTIDTHFVMVMEYVEGVTIESILHQGPIPVPQALSYIDQAVDALGFAHRKGIIHRDIKPANLMLMSSGTVKLMDFGIARGDADARLTQTGAAMGTFTYMSPEQIMGQNTDARSDLYSMGITIYEMVTGVAPYVSDSGYKILDAHLNAVPRQPIEVQPHLPQRLNQIILKLIAKMPEDRFQSADELRAALKTVMDPRLEQMPVSKPERSATMFEAAPSAFARAQAGAGYTEFLNPKAPPPDVQRVTPIATRKEAAKSRRAIAAGLALCVVGAAAVATYATWSHKEADKKVQTPATPAAPNNTPPVNDPTQAVAHPPPKAATPKPGGPVVLPSEANVKAKQAAATSGTKDGRLGLTPVPGSGPVADLRKPAPQPPSPNTPPGPTPEEKSRLDAIDRQLLGYDRRAGAYNGQLNSMQEQMKHQGLSLRTDIMTAQQGMNSNLERARQALSRNDAKNAEEYTAQAKSDLDTIESFLHPK